MAVAMATRLLYWPIMFLVGPLAPLCGRVEPEGKIKTDFFIPNYYYLAIGHLQKVTPN
jgi:hypothetical protein